MDHLARIKADEQRIKEAMARGDLRIPINPLRQFAPQQLGLVQVMADQHGHLWIVGREELTQWVRVLPG